MTLNQQFHRLAEWAAAHGLTSAALPADAAAATAKEPSQTQFAAAMDELQHGDWHHAYEHLAVLADAGDERAARTALMMHARGTRMFGGSFAADPARCQRWLAAAGDSAPAREAH